MATAKFSRATSSARRASSSGSRPRKALKSRYYASGTWCAPMNALRMAGSHRWVTAAAAAYRLLNFKFKKQSQTRLKNMKLKRAEIDCEWEF